MKRPAFLIAAIITVSAVVLYISGEIAVFCLAFCSILAAVILFVLRNKYKIGLKTSAVFLISGVICIYFCLLFKSANNVTASLVGETKSIVCTVTEEPAYGDGYTILVVSVRNESENNHIAQRDLRLKLFVSDTEDAAFAKMGDVVSATVTFKSTDLFYRRYELSEQRYISASCESAKIVGHRSSLYEVCINLRQQIRKSIDTYLKGDEAALLKGILLGDTSALSSEIESDFRLCGVSHITAVSGLHISVLCGMFLSFFSFALSKRKAALISLIPLLAVVAITGFMPSAIRAGIMCAITLLGTAFLQRSDSINSLGIAVTAMLIYNPFYVLDLSFQLSCCATLGVIIFSSYGIRLSDKIKVNNAKLKSLIDKALLVFVQSIGAVLFTLPIQIIEFGYISLVAPIANMLISAVVSYAMILAVVGVIVSFVPIINILCYAPFVIASVLLKYMIFVVRWLSKMPFSYVAFGSNSAILWVGLSLALVAIWLLLRRVGGVKLVTLFVVALLMISLWSDYIIRYNGVTFAVMDVGRGFCTVISSGSKGIIIGCGDDKADRYEIADYLKVQGVTDIEAIIIPSQQQTCFGGYNSLIKAVSPQRVVVSQDCSNISYSKTVETVYDKVSLETEIDNLTLDIINTEYGLVCKLQCFNKIVVIGCCSYDMNVIKTGKINMLITSRAIPENVRCDFAVVTGCNGLS